MAWAVERELLNRKVCFKEVKPATDHLTRPGKGGNRGFWTVFDGSGMGFLSHGGTFDVMYLTPIVH
jgi:hypothetical protein